MSDFTRLRRGAMVAGALAVTLALVLGTRELSLRSQKAREDGGWPAVRIAIPRADDRLLFGPAERRLEIFAYRPRPSVPRPIVSVLLVHGNRRAGATHPLYRLIADRLAARGASVLALSLPGFGESDPFPPDHRVTAGDFVAAVADALEYLRENSDPTRPLLFVGHSFGANLALASCGTPGLKVAAVEPGRRLHEQVVAPNAPELTQFVRKLRANVRGGIVDSEAVRSIYDVLDPAHAASPVKHGSCAILHSAVLPTHERLAVEQIASAHPGTDLIWLNNRDHEFGVASLPIGVVYPGPTINELVATIISFALSKQP